MTVRDFSTAEVISQIEADKPDVEYLKAALLHYKAVYGNLLEDYEKLRDALREARPILALLYDCSEEV